MVAPRKEASALLTYQGFVVDTAQGMLTVQASYEITLSKTPARHAWAVRTAESLLRRAGRVFISDSDPISA